MADETTRGLRRKILDGDVDALSNLQRAWLDTANQLYAAAVDGESMQAEPVTFGPQTYLLATICDTGPANIDPTSLTDVLAIVQGWRFRSQGKFGPGYAAASDEEVGEMGHALRSATHVLNRMTFAWIALENGEPGEPAHNVKRIKPGGETLRVIELLQKNLDVDAIVSRTGKSKEAVWQINCRLGKGLYDLGT